MRFSKRLVVAFLALGVIAVAAAVYSPALAGRDSWLGVRLQMVDDDLREALGLEDRTGALLSGISADGPADEAGLEEGDVIIEIDGHRVRSPRDIVRAVREADPGDRMELEIVRDRDHRQVTVTVGTRSDADEERSVDPWRPDVEVVPPVPPIPPDLPERGMGPEGWGNLAQWFGRPRLGVETRRIDEDLAPYFGVDADEGVLVLEVMEDTPAEKAGLRTGDVIVELENEPVRSPGELRDRLLENEGDQVALELIRRGERMTFEIELDEPDHDLVRRLRIRSPRESEGLRRELDRLREEIERLRDEIRDLGREQD